MTSGETKKVCNFATSVEAAGERSTAPDNPIRRIHIHTTNTMKKILLTCAACLAMLASCAQKGEKAAALTEPATITWIADKPGTSLHPYSLFPGVPDSLWNALGLQ